MAVKKEIIFKTIGMELKIDRDCLTKIDSISDGLVIDLKNNTHILHTNLDMPEETKVAIITAINKFTNVKLLTVDLFNFKNPTQIEI